MKNRMRLLYQRVLTEVALALGFNHRLTQFCDRCGRTKWCISWWDETNEVWKAVAGNVNGQRHGCFCPNCFTIMARDIGIRLNWQPVIYDPEINNELSRKQHRAARTEGE